MPHAVESVFRCLVDEHQLLRVPVPHPGIEHERTDLARQIFTRTPLKNLAREAKLEPVRIGLECKHVDVEMAFLSGVLDDVVIYMEQRSHYEDGTDRVCMLK